MKTEELSLLVSALSLIASTVATATSVVSYRASRRNLQVSAELEAEKRWTMSVSSFPSGNLIVSIDYDREGPRIRFLEVSVIDPEGLKIQKYSQRFDDVPGDQRRKTAVLIPSEEGSQTTVTINRDMNERTISGGTISLMLLMPQKPYWAQNVSSIIRLAVKYEELDAGRRRRDIIIRGPEVAWAT